MPAPTLLLRTFDLNLLKVFDVVMAERNLTRAAQVLSLTQPAVSNALRRLREALDDDLLVRQGRSLQPTPKALELWPEIRATLERLQTTLAPRLFAPASAQHSFVLTMADATAAELMVGLVTTLSAQAPGVSLRTVPLTTRDPRRLLEDGLADLAIGHFPAVLSDITLRHVDIEGGGRMATSDTDLLYLVNKFTNITVSYCFLHDTSRTMILTWPASGNGMLIEYSKFARNGNAEHREAWSAGADSNVIVRHNLFEDILGTGVIAIVNSKGVASNWDVYGNVFYHTGKYTDGIINTGILFNRYDAGGSPIAVQAKDWRVFNNVVANIRSGSFTAAFTSQNSVNYVVENNIWFNNQPADVGANGVTTADYNWFYGNGGSGARGPHDINGTGSPFVDAQPWISGNWALKAPIGGLALAAPYNIDMNGTVRGADGVFDRGALEFSSQAAAVQAPTSLQVK